MLLDPSEVAKIYFRRGQSMNDYQILGIHPNATSSDVRAAYKTLALVYHPDRSTGNAELFKKVNKAYQNLQAIANNSSVDCEKDESAKMAATWSGLGTHKSSSQTARPVHPSSSTPLASSMRSRTPSFMNPTQNSKNSANPKLGRHAPSTAPPKPSTLDTAGTQRRRAATLAASAAQPIIRDPVLPVSFQRADLTDVILDVSPQAFAVIGGSHLKFRAMATRRSDGMTGSIAGVLPATGEVFWHKNGATYVSVASGNAMDYYVKTVYQPSRENGYPSASSSKTDPAHDQEKTVESSGRIAKHIDVFGDVGNRCEMRFRTNSISGVFGNIGGNISGKVDRVLIESSSQEASPLTPITPSFNSRSPNTSGWPLRFPVTSAPVIRSTTRI